jgi:hypothetical protein
MREDDPETGERIPLPPEPPTLEISAEEWVRASRDPVIRDFVREAVTRERKMEREGLIFP